MHTPLTGYNLLSYAEGAGSGRVKLGLGQGSQGEATFKHKAQTPTKADPKKRKHPDTTSLHPAPRV